ncbi:MAG: M48 family metalloprotease [Sutterella sp.]|nr:M48 family metalloprotease [Sutterella sp.]
MTVSASLIEHAFLSILALYAVLECALAIMQTRAAERSSDRVPEGFEGRLSLAAFRKAADYTGEITQANLLLAFVGAAFALAMTKGGGLTVLAGFYETLFGPGIGAQWCVIVTVLALMTAAELPFGWWARFRVRERYGYMREARLEWLGRTVLETTAGWLIVLPLAAFTLTVFEYAGDFWWLLAWAVWTFRLFWRWQITRVEGIFWRRRSRPFEDEAVRTRTDEYLRRHGIVMTDMIVMTRPMSWDHANVVLAGWGRKRCVVVFAHAAAQLTPDELLAAVAHETGHLKHFHSLLRMIVFSAVGFVCCRLAGWAAAERIFFEGIGFSPVLTSDMPGTHAGWVLAFVIVAFPVLMYPLAPFVNLFSRLLQYDADRFAARTVGTGAMIGAMVRLHRDYSMTLTPSRLYSLFHYRRPHVGMRVAALRRYGPRGPLDAGAAETAESSVS